MRTPFLRTLGLAILLSSFAHADVKLPSILSDNMVLQQRAVIPICDIPAKWVVCSPTTLGVGGWNGFSGVGYYFGQELQSELKTPVGLIQDAWGGTPAEAWTRASTLAADPELSVLLDHYEQALK